MYDEPFYAVYLNHTGVEHPGRDTVLNPGAVLARLRQRCGLPFEQRMVHWPQGPKPYDGVWAPYWYANVHRTTGFENKADRRRPLPPNLGPLYREAVSYYENLLPFSINA